MKAEKITNASAVGKNMLKRKDSKLISNGNMITSEMKNAISAANYFSPNKF